MKPFQDTLFSWIRKFLIFWNSVNIKTQSNLPCAILNPLFIGSRTLVLFIPLLEFFFAFFYPVTSLILAHAHNNETRPTSKFKMEDDFSSVNSMIQYPEWQRNKPRSGIAYRGLRLTSKLAVPWWHEHWACMDNGARNWRPNWPWYHKLKNARTQSFSSEKVKPGVSSGVWWRFKAIAKFGRQFHHGQFGRQFLAPLSIHAQCSRHHGTANLDVRFRPLYAIPQRGLLYHKAQQAECLYRR